MTTGTVNQNRFSSYTNASTGSGSKDGGEKKDMWSSMLDSVASSKRLPEKNILMLGGTVESQRDFLETLSNQGQRRNFDRSNKLPPVANSFALGYTYYDVLDADQEDILARISSYSLTNPDPSFSTLLQPLLTPQSIPNTLIVILLDWSQPWKWMRQLRQWILLLRTVLVSLSSETKETMEEVMVGWRDRGRQGGTNLDGSGAAAAGSDGDVALPLGPGEWEDALGLPLCVVCQNASQMEVLEKTQGWKEEEFDVVLQFMRTILLKHGASLIYTTPTMSSQLQSLVHASLGIHSLLKKHPLKHNVIDRDKIVVPPNWDSWGKIRVLREGFDVELVSNGWSIDLDQPLPRPHQNGGLDSGITSGRNEETDDESDDPEGSTVSLYESSVKDPTMDALQLAGRNSHSSKLEVETIDTQSFLAEQSKYLDMLKQKRDEAIQTKAAARKGDGESGLYTGRAGEGSLNDQIGPVQFNMGGIQVDADDMVQRLKDRQTYGSSPEPMSPEPDPAVMDPKMDTDNMQQFFQSLMQGRR